MIQIAIVAPVDRSDVNKFGRGSEFYKGSMWTATKKRIRRRCLESLTPAGVKLELSAFLERFMGKSIALQVVCPLHTNKPIAAAIAELLPHVPVHVAPHGYKKFGAQRDLASGEFRFTPFRYDFHSREVTNYTPHWYEPPEPPILLKSLGGDFYTYPSTTDDEGDDTTTENAEIGEEP